MVSVHLENPICSQPCLSQVLPALPVKHFWCWSDGWWPILFLSRNVVERFLFLHLFPPGDRWCDRSVSVSYQSVWLSLCFVCLLHIIIMKEFVKHKILSIETIPSPHTQRHLHTRAFWLYKAKFKQLIVFYTLKVSSFPASFLFVFVTWQNPLLSRAKDCSL